MITMIRKRLITSRALKVIIWAVIVVLVGSLGVPGLMQQTSQLGWIATINGVTVGTIDFARKTADQESQIALFKQQYGSQADFFLRSLGDKANPKQLALDVVIREELLNQVARNLSLRIHPDYAAKKLEDMAYVQYNLSDLVPYNALTQTGISMRHLQDYLRRMHLSMADFEDRVDDAIRRAQVTSLVRQAAYTPAFERDDYYASAHAAKKFSFATVSFDALLAQEQKTSIAEQELHAFFNAENAKSRRYHVPENRTGIVWQFTAATYGITIDAAAIERYYELNKTRLFVDSEAQVEVRRILLTIPDESKRADVVSKMQKLKMDLTIDPTAFAAKAQELSDDAQTRAAGGLMAPFSRASQEPIFDRTAFLLEKDGDISDIIETSQGLELVQRVSKKPATFKPLALVKQDIVQTLEVEEFARQFAHDAQRIEQDGGQAALEALVAEKAGKKVALTNIERAVASSPASKALFNLGAIGAIATLQEGSVGSFVLLTHIEEEFVPALSDKADEVAQDLYEARARVAVAKEVEKIHAMLQEGKTLSQAAAECHAKIEHTEAIAHDNDRMIASLRARGLPIEAMGRMEKAGLVAMAVGAKDGFVIRLDELIANQASGAQAEKDAVLERLAQDREFAVEKGFVASLHRNATIKINQSLVNA